jgi:hypothetical protein
MTGNNTSIFTAANCKVSPVSALRWDVIFFLGVQSCMHASATGGWQLLQVQQQLPKGFHATWQVVRQPSSL